MRMALLNEHGRLIARLRYAVSVKRHIREGICIPLDVKPDQGGNMYSTRCKT